ncbi:MULTISPECIES: hypothetical protein [Microbacterium]|uniref:hypothetical protein n=1 Tax=Microbacterium TaxID=33882 RepID=UPI00128F3FDD|nr:hypothetical protein [Microbacterium oxydans]
MDHLLPAAPWLMAAAAVVSAAATAALWRAVPWQGRQASLIMAAAMLALAATDGRNPLVGLVLGAVLLVSAMVGTMGVRGTAAAASCCHRALVSLVMAMCAFDGVVAADPVGGGASASVSSGHGGHGLSGVLSVLVLVGVVGVVLWTVVAEWFVAPVHRGRTARLLTVESWAMAAGVAVMCLGF